MRIKYFRSGLLLSASYVKARVTSTIVRMKALVVAALLLVAACSDGLGSPPAHDDLSSGIVQSVAQIELGSPVRASADGEADDPEPRFGNQIVVRLDDGRTVILVYTGARRFQAGQRVHVHVSDLSAFMM